MKIKIDGLMVLLLLVVAFMVFLSVKLRLRKEWFDPTSDQNLAYQGAGALGDALGIPGEDARGVPLDDYVFATFDLLNPFNASDVYARQVWGLD